MELTPLDIRNQKFSTKKLGGLDPDEVQAFLNQVATTLENLLVERADLLKTISNDKKTVENYHELEELLKGSLVTMQRFMNETKANAHKEADLIIAEAKSKAEKEVDAIRNQATGIRADIDRLKQMRTGFIAQIRNFMRVQQELLSGMEEQN